MNVYELADALEKIETYNQVIHRSFNDKTKLRASADILRKQADRIAELESNPRELSDEEIEECIVAWVKEIYGNEYVTPSDSHITQGTRLIKLAEEMRLNK